MIELGMLSYNSAYTNNEQYTLSKESKQSFYSTKNTLIINLNRKLQKPFDSFVVPRALYLACSLVG